MTRFLLRCGLRRHPLRRVSAVLGAAILAGVQGAQACDTALVQARLAKLGRSGIHAHGLSAGAVVHNGPYPSRNIALLDHMPVSAFPGSADACTDIWGYASGSGREYAIVGLSNGTAFVEVTDPANPVVVGHIAHINACCSDAKVYKDHAFIVSEEDNIGMKVVDLRNIDSGIVTEVTTFTGGGLRQAHNIAINEDSGYAYICGALNNASLGGLMVVDVSKPAQPKLAGLWSGEYVHDVQVVTYTQGPYAGRELAFAFSGFLTPGLRVLDATVKSNIWFMGFSQYPNAAFAHQGWLSEDRRYLFLGDEFDEMDYGVPTSTHVIDVSDPRHPEYVKSFGSGLPSTDHNMTVRDDFVFQANYTSGVRIFHVPSVSLIKEVGYFDTHPQDDNIGFHGAWGIYAGLPSGNLLVTDIENGLFILDPSAALAQGQPLPAASWPLRLVLGGTVIVLAGFAVRRATGCAQWV